MRKDPGMKDHCLAAAEASHRDWLHANRAENDPQMTSFLDSAIELYIPHVRSMLDEGKAVIRVARSSSLPTAFHLPCRCSCGETVRNIVLNSKLMLLLWRVLIILRSLVKDIQYVHEQHVVVYREPSEDDCEQLELSYKMYIREGEPESHRLLELLGTVAELPSGMTSVVNDVVALAELFVVCHEICHFMPIGTVDPNAFPIDSEFKLRPSRTRRWREELAADVNGSYLLMSTMAVRLGEAPLEAPSEIPEQVLTRALPAIWCALDVLWFVENFELPTLATMDFANDPAFAAHPPVQLRKNYVSQWFYGQKHWPLAPGIALHKVLTKAFLSLLECCNPRLERIRNELAFNN
jgi:hypothetical protein